MQELKNQVRQARRRLLLEQFLRNVSWSLFAALCVAALALGIPKLWHLPVDAQTWTIVWIAGATAAGLIVAGVWTFVIRRSTIDAAIEIDRRYGLKERISSTLALSDREIKSDIGQALVNDAMRQSRRIDVRDQFQVRATWISLLPIVPGILAAMFVLVPNAASDNSAKAKSTESASKKQIKKSTEELRKEIEKRRKSAEEAGLKNAEDLFKELEQGVGNLNRQQMGDRKRALSKLNDLADTLKKRRSELGGRDALRSQMKSLKDVKRGPGDKIVRSLKNGDLPQAMEGLNQLRDQLKNGELSEQQQKALAEQLEQMAKNMQQMVSAHEDAKRQLEQQIQRKLNSGDLSGAGDLQRKLDQLKARDPQMNRLGQMASKLSQSAESSRQCDSSQTAQQLGEMISDLEAMQREFDELELLEDAMDQIDMSKMAMNCSNCQGAGCTMCQGFGSGMGQNQNGQGDGLGEGRGRGDRPERENDTQYYDSQVRGQIGKGRAVVVDYVNGHNLAGEAREGIKASLDTAKRAIDDPLAGQRMPRGHRQQAEQYFDAFREGE